MSPTLTTIETLQAVRKEFEEKRVDRDLLVRLYRDYARVSDLERFVQQSIELFPNLNCGLASLYLQHRLGKGTVTQGAYGKENHTFLILDDGHIADITADQYGGPAVYCGPLQEPWHVTMNVQYA